MPIVEGKAAMREFVAGSLNIPGFSVTWQAHEAGVSQDGRIGSTTGENQFTAPDPGGELLATSGRYVTVWRKEPDGSWKCVVDIWNTGHTQ
jgi:ketosteroid isomerase-like protein